MINLEKPLDEKDGWKLLEQKTINDRTLVCYYEPKDKVINLVLFHLTDRPNILAQESAYSTWGYVTHFESGIYKEKEAAEVVSLYLQDMEKDNAWWETERWQKK